MYKKYIKRILDVLLSTVALIILFPVIIVVSFLVKIKLGSPVIFKQERPGKNGVIFKLFKFRSMTNEKDENGNLLPDNFRLTKFGRFLRSSSLDELPELLNILRGEMSIVGPRPLAVEYLPYYNEFEKHRHDVLPGLTGLAQINGRTALDWEKRFQYDIEYVQNVSFYNDVKIIFKTVKKVFCKEDIVEAGRQGDFNIWREKQLSKGDDD